MLPKHGIDRRAKLNCILIDAAGVHPEVFKPIYCGLLRIELYLPPPSFVHNLALVLTLLQVLIDDLLFFPSIKEYCVGRDFAANTFAKYNLAVGFTLQEAYKRYAGGLRAISWQARLVSLTRQIGASTAITAWHLLHQLSYRV